MGGEAVLFCCGTTRPRVVPPIQDQVSLLFLVEEGDGNHDSGQYVGELLAVMPVGPTQHHSERNAFGVGQKGSFTARFAPVSGVAAGGFSLSGSPLFPSGAFTMQPSASCHSQSIPSNSPYS